jgi:hypothetical protein
MQDLVVFDCRASEVSGGVIVKSNQIIEIARVNVTQCLALTDGSALTRSTDPTPDCPAAVLYSVFNSNSGQDCACSRASSLTTYRKCAFISNTVNQAIFSIYSISDLILESAIQGDSGSIFHRGGLARFILVNCSISSSPPAGGGIFSRSIGNEWNFELDLDRYTQTFDNFTNPPFSGVWATEETYDMRRLFTLSRSPSPPTMSSIPTQSPELGDSYDPNWSKGRYDALYEILFTALPCVVTGIGMLCWLYCPCCPDCPVQPLPNQVSNADQEPGQRDLDESEANGENAEEPLWQDSNWVPVAVPRPMPIPFPGALPSPDADTDPLL